jgi:tetratricopeptide (TPR) repeat protein
MRETLRDPSLARHAGRFVWLELDIDRPVNQAFVVRHNVMSTPTLLILDPSGEKVTATHFGGLTLEELGPFLDRGERGARGRVTERPDAALLRGDGLMGRGRPADAVAAYREALRLAPPDWPARARVLGNLVMALRMSGQVKSCAETAASEAPAMARDAIFATTVRIGLQCAEQGSEAARRTIEPLAAEATALPGIQRDDRFEIYQALMDGAAERGDTAALSLWGERWLGEIESTTPGSDDERSALDIARVDAVSLLGTPERALPALGASEKAMPGNYNASLRYAQVAVAAKRYDDAVAACDRGLIHATGPLGCSWILDTKAEALRGKGDTAGARAALQEARKAADRIGSPSMRENNLRKVDRMLEELTKGGG